jgi:hypothetical protein
MRCRALHLAAVLAMSLRWVAAQPDAGAPAPAAPIACGEPGGPCSEPLNGQFTDEQRALMPPCAPDYGGGCAPGSFCINHFSNDAPPRCEPPPDCGALGTKCCPGSDPAAPTDAPGAIFPVHCGPGLACNAGGLPYFSVDNSECFPLEACGAADAPCCQPLGSRHAYAPVPPGAGARPDGYPYRLLCARGMYCEPVPDPERYRDTYGGESWYFRVRSLAPRLLLAAPRRAPPCAAPDCYF